MLYIIATPIGNLEDITLRALKTLFSVYMVLCEDTRKTSNLLQHFKKDDGVIPKLISFYEENEVGKIPEIIGELKKGTDIALVTNAGTPTISDPGFKLVRECWREGIKVVSIPGPSSPIVALSVSGLPTDKFTFVGFPPNKSGQRTKFFEKIKLSTEVLSSTIIFFESPFRVFQSLSDLQKVFGDIEIVVAREMTKIYEEIKHDKISNFLSYFGKKQPKGEFVILFNIKL